MSTTRWRAANRAEYDDYHAMRGAAFRLVEEHRADERAARYDDEIAMLLAADKVVEEWRDEAAKDW